MDTIDFLRSHEHKGEGRFVKDAQFVKENWDWLQYSYALAIKVRSRMVELGWTQKQLAQALDCTQQHVSVILNGRVNMTLETIAKLEKALQFDLIGKSLISFSAYTMSARPNSYLSEPNPSEVSADLHTRHLVEGYGGRKKKGPKSK